MLSEGTTLFLFGGITTAEKDQSGTTVDANIYLLDTSVQPWTWSILKALGASPPARTLHCMEFYTEKQIVIFGGMSVCPGKHQRPGSVLDPKLPDPGEESCKSMNDLYILDLTTMTFTRPFVANFVPPPRYGAGIASNKDPERPVLLLVGGLNTEYCYIDPFQLKEVALPQEAEWKLKEHHLNKERGETVMKESLRQATDIIAQNNSRIIELEGIYSELLRQEYV